jgi:BirA family transcriptional regulator, biotin operon repressor / biotin---[acetyl-CoA-carboxylase] ligase
VATSSDGVWTARLNSADVQGALGSTRIVSAVHGVAEVGSTQDLALELARDGSPSGTVVIADLQTSGRGRSGRRWDDRAGGGTLAMTVLLDAEVVEHASLVPHALGVAVVDACSAVASLDGRLLLKWPNDVVHRDAVSSPVRKVCGVLVERAIVDAPDRERDVLVCGIGLDVDLRAEAATDRVCLAELAGDVPDRAELLGALITAVDGALLMLATSPARLLARYRSLSDTVGRAVSIEPVLADEGAAARGRVVGVATGVDDAGRLLVTTEGVTRAILSGTVRDAGPHGGAP